MDRIFYLFIFFKHTSYYIASLADMFLTAIELLRFVSRMRLVARGLDTIRPRWSKMLPCASCLLSLSGHTISARNDAFDGKHYRKA